MPTRSTGERKEIFVLSVSPVLQTSSDGAGGQGGTDHLYTLVIKSLV